MLLEPQILLSALESEYKSDRNEQINNQIDFLENQIKETKVEDEKLYKAYLAEVFDETEFAERRKQLKAGIQILLDDIARLRGSLMTQEQYEERRQEIVMICNNASASGLAMDAPFELKQRIIKTIVDKITLNVNEGWFELEGVIGGQYSIFKNETALAGGTGNQEQKNNAIVSSPKDMSSSPRSSGNWRGR